MFLDSKQEATDPGKAEIFNQFFQSIFTSDNNLVHSISHDPSPTLCDISFSEDDVFHYLSSLDVTKAMGID